MIRPARPDDIPEILRLIRDLATYEKARHEVVATAEDLRRALFGPDPSVSAHVVDLPDDRLAGFALWFVNFSTWLGKPGLYLEDLYVEPRMRGRGYGRALLTELARIAVARGYGRMEWAVLNWNSAAHRFYESLGARQLDEWTVWRLSGPALRALGS